MERELGVLVGVIGLYAALIVGGAALAARARSVVVRKRMKVGLLESMLPMRGPAIDVLRVGDGAIVTVRDDIDEDVARDAREIVGDMIEDGVARIVLEVDGPSPSTPLLGLLTEVAETSAVARVHLSLVISDGDVAASIGESTFGGNIPVFVTSVNREHVAP